MTATHSGVVSPGEVPAIVLAGGKAKPDLLAATGQEKRALVSVNGRTLLAHIVDAIAQAQRTLRTGQTPETVTHAPASSPSITVVGDMPADAQYSVLPDAGGFVENLFQGLRACSDAPFVLIATSDLPFVTGDMVADFVRDALQHAQSEQADLIWPIVPVSLCYARFPGVQRTALKLREGRYTGGNLALARPHMLLQHQSQIAAAYAARKSPLRLAAMLGGNTVARLLGSQMLSPGLLTIASLEGRVSRLLGAQARALPCTCPELATDLDRAADFAAVGISSALKTPPTI